MGIVKEMGCWLILVYKVHPSRAAAGVLYVIGSFLIFLISDSLSLDNESDVDTDEIISSNVDGLNLPQRAAEQAEQLMRKVLDEAEQAEQLVLKVSLRSFLSYLPGPLLILSPPLLIFSYYIHPQVSVLICVLVLFIYICICIFVYMYTFMSYEQVSVHNWCPSRSHPFRVGT